VWVLVWGLLGFLVAFLVLVWERLFGLVLVGAE
jgi:hypothetical protein